MQSYCENNSVCRRKFFYDIFNEQISSKSSPSAAALGYRSVAFSTSAAQGFKSCGNMCDICCRKRSGSASSSSSLTLQPSAKALALAAPKASFQKASAMMSAKQKDDNVIAIDEDDEDGWISSSKRSSLSSSSVTTAKKRSTEIVIIDDEDQHSIKKPCFKNQEMSIR
jgi:hypothetical protein